VGCCAIIGTDENAKRPNIHAALIIGFFMNTSLTFTS
jgi:hypothetical protein